MPYWQDEALLEYTEAYDGHLLPSRPSARPRRTQEGGRVMKEVFIGGTSSLAAPRIM